LPLPLDRILYHIINLSLHLDILKRVPGTSQLGLQPVPLVAIDEETKQRIVHQVYASPISLY
jgi:hypothetical protein